MMENSEMKTGNWFVDELNYYQAANSDNESLRKNFVIRKAEFEIIVDDLRRKNDYDPLQHELVLGRRGSGKSTLLKRIQIEIEEDPELAKKYVAVNLAEEQAGIYRLSDLWFEVWQELKNQLNTATALAEFSTFANNQDYTRYLFLEIHKVLTAAHKKAVVLLDNLDRILENLDDDGHLLRELLLNYNDLQLIGGSTRMDEHFWQYDKPFYDFFRKHHLASLQFEEIDLLLNHWSDAMKLPELQGYALKNQGKIEAIRILTDGLPRTLQFFIQILLQESDLYGFDYIRRVMDKATPLYQERLNSLTAPQRKIVLEMAFLWEACSTKQLVEKCRIESKLISSFVKQLTGFGIVETISTNNKNHLYRLSERFFNMWLIITQGNPEQKRKALWLTIFLESWYDANELKSLAHAYKQKLKQGLLSYDKASVLTKGFSQSKYITTDDRDELIDLTTQLEQKIINNPLGLPRRFKEILIELKELIETEEYELALQKIDEIENEEDGIKFHLRAHVCHVLLRLEEAEKYYLKAIEKGDRNALFNLAILYDDQNKTQQAEAYYLKAIEKEDTEALNNLALLYQNQKKAQQAERYYLKAIEQGNTNALYNLANLYSGQNKTLQAEAYFLKAIEQGHTNALYNLANLYSDQNKAQQAEEYYLKAIEKGDTNALYNLAILYQNQNKAQQAEAYYLKAIEKGNTNAFNNLANLYENQNKVLQAEEYYLKAIENGNTKALFNLANLYKNQNKALQAEAYYLKAIEKGNAKALNNLANLYENQNKILQAEAYYLKAIEKGDTKALNNLANLYSDQNKAQQAEAYYLKAIEKGDTTALNNLAILYYEEGKHKSKALQYITEYHQSSKNKNSSEIEILVRIWNGDFENVEVKINQLFTDYGYEELDELIENLLYQEQKHLVLSLFESEQHGKALKDRYVLLYYATLLLTNKVDNNLELRIPPEVMATVEAIIEKVKEKNAFYAR